MKQVYNPYLPLNEYIPDGEPHVFGDRVYIFGSHDKEGGHTFCMRDYVTYSAPVDDLTNWRYEGVIYKASNDPKYNKIFDSSMIALLENEDSANTQLPNEIIEDDSKKLKYMYAPDVVRGNDGKYYLFYCMGGEYGYGGYTGPIAVAVCDTPAGEYKYLGHVKHKDGSLMLRFICFDPAVINDNGTVRLYYGTQYGYEEEQDFETNSHYMDSEIEMFGRTKEEILSYRENDESIMGVVMLTLEDDMLTVKDEPKHIIPYKVKGTTFEAHPFFEGASIRKVNDKYYFVYSSWQNHELCYAISDYPDKDFIFGGTIVSNGDVGLNGRKPEDKLNMTGTTHGGIECINGEWYVFYHRLTHKSDYSRQSCAEKIQIKSDGSIDQVEVTSCGLNGKPLAGKGVYPAVIACNITQGQMPHGSNTVYGIEFPNVTNLEEERFIAEIENETIIGYKYFDLSETKNVSVRIRFENADNKVLFNGPLRKDERCADEEKRISEYKKSVEEYTGENPYIEIRSRIDGNEIGRIIIDKKTEGLQWCNYSGIVNFEEKISAIYFVYHGNEKIQFIDFELS